MASVPKAEEVVSVSNSSHRTQSKSPEPAADHPGAPRVPGQVVQVEQSGRREPHKSRSTRRGDERQGSRRRGRAVRCGHDILPQAESPVRLRPCRAGRGSAANCARGQRPYGQGPRGNNKREVGAGTTAPEQVYSASGRTGDAKKSSANQREPQRDQPIQRPTAGATQPKLERRERQQHHQDKTKRDIPTTRRGQERANTRDTHDGAGTKLARAEDRSQGQGGEDEAQPKHQTSPAAPNRAAQRAGPPRARAQRPSPDMPHNDPPPQSYPTTPTTPPTLLPTSLTKDPERANNKAEPFRHNLHTLRHKKIHPR
uniref:Uncharacterized protein n=1 Tax=Knipowitschia caucasica TaxID=637954 RepID=A0AAV2LKS1_KNICA